MAGTRNTGIQVYLSTIMVIFERLLCHHVLIGRIEASNKDSLTLFQRNGFAPVGVMRQVGFKQQRWLGVFILERTLRAYL
jgi:L-amino acid N-acyltransferase YncA